MNDTRRKRERHGRRAEDVAALYLRLKGYSVLERRLRLATGEIDLIARKGNLLVFVEVKARPDLDQALNAMPIGSWHRVARTAESWVSRKSHLTECDWRYDLIAVVPPGIPRHFIDYWRP